MPPVVQAACICLQKISSLYIGSKALIEQDAVPAFVDFVFKPEHAGTFPPLPS